MTLLPFYENASIKARNGCLQAASMMQMTTMCQKSSTASLDGLFRVQSHLRQVNLSSFDTYKIIKRPLIAGLRLNIFPWEGLTFNTEALYRGGGGGIQRICFTCLIKCCNILVIM